MGTCNFYFYIYEKPIKKILFRYYEGKEDEVKMKSYKPGKISDELRVNLY